MAAFTEQQVRERLLTNYMDGDPLMIELERPIETTTAAGGVVTTGTTTLDPQRFKFIPFKRRLTEEYHYNPQSYGEERVEYIHYILIGDNDADIEVGDKFTSAGSDLLEDGVYEVMFVSPRRWDRCQAGILYRG